VTEYLERDDLRAAADAAVDGRAEVRDVGLLQAAAARPQATAFGEEAYPGLDAKAAALLQSIVAGHPLVDGNKRLGWVAVRLFYLMNGLDIHPPGDEAFDLIVAIAGGELRDVSAIAEVLSRWRSARSPLFESGQPNLASRVDEELTGFGE
jgi:death-on-curing protein